MPRTYRRFRASYNKALRARVRFTESRVARDALVAAARNIPRPVVNRAQRGLILNQGEFKSVDMDFQPPVTSASLVQLLNGVSRGDEINQRTGREIVMKSIQVDGFVRSTAATGVSQIHRVMIVYDRQTNATALTAAQVLEGLDWKNPRSLENRRRFKILYDRKFVLSAAGQAGDIRRFQWYRHLAHPVTFNSGDNGTVADITTGSLYAVFVGTEAAGVTAGSADFSSRIRFVDP